MVSLSKTGKVSGGTPSVLPAVLQGDGHLEALPPFVEYFIVVPDGYQGLLPASSSTRYLLGIIAWNPPNAGIIYYLVHCPEGTMASETLITFFKTGQDLY